jgi:integrase
MEKAPGRVVWGKDAQGVERWHTRVRELDGSEPRRPIDANWATDHGPDAKAKAKQVAAVLARGIRTARAVPRGTGQTVQEYGTAWLSWRESQGLACVSGDKSTLLRHVYPSIGHLPIKGVTRDDLKRLVLVLDAKAKKGKSDDGKPFAWKSAVNAWAIVLALFRDATKSKRPDLCVLETNPARDLAGPDVGAKKSKQYVYPAEFLQLVSCTRVPLRWRRLFSLAIYSYARAGELSALKWSDVNLAQGVIHVHQSEDRNKGRKRGVGSTKSGVARRIPIEPALLPLLQALHKESGAKGAVFSLPSQGMLSRKLRVYLRRAGVTRDELHTTTATRKAITFHDLRATGVTWALVRGDGFEKVMQRAGHEDVTTTQIYMREAENLSAAFGTVFPPLPASILAGPTLGQKWAKIPPSARIGLGNLVGAAGLEPATSSV